MTFEKILSLDVLRLPVQGEEGLSFKEQLTMLLQKVEKLVLESTHWDNEKFDETTFKKRYKQLTKGILEAIEYYYKGDPVEAYVRLEKALKENNTINYLPTVVFDINTNFYRMRKKEGNYPLTKGELFHVPFEKRFFIKTQRYSILGFPTLYLSNSLYVAWEEMKRPNSNLIKAVRLVNTRKIECLDLTSSRYSVNYEWKPQPNVASSKEKNDVYSMMVWPIIAACSFKVRNTNADFKPEYIIPQLMLQYVSRNGEIKGIKFSSTHIDLNNPNIKGDFYNVAIPVKDNHEKGYCSILKSDFNSTEVLSFEIKQFSENQNNLPILFLNSEGKYENVNSDIQQIELIMNKPILYSHSSFGSLELSLREMPTTRWTNS